MLAIFVMTISTLLIADLMWRQFVLFRTIDNQQTTAQAQFLLHGAQDWARSILQDQPHPSYDALSDSWAQPLAQTRLDQLGETSATASRATLEGGIEDAQARFNLHNLLDAAGNVNPTQLAILEKLGGMLSAPSDTAKLIAAYLAQTYNNTPLNAAASPANIIAPTANQPPPAYFAPLTQGMRPIPPVFPEDLAAVPGISPAAAQALAPFVILLDQPATTINFNTASPEIMAAAIPELSISDANALAAERDRAYFVNTGDIQNRLHGRGGSMSMAGISTNSQYFIVHGVVRLDNAATRMRALVRRYGAGPQGSVTVLWERDS